MEPLMNRHPLSRPFDVPSSCLSRRRALQIAGVATLSLGTGIGAASAAPAIAPETAARNAAAWQATATPNAEGVIPSPMPGVPAVYTRYPAPWASVTEVPGKGGKVRIFWLTDKRIKPRGENTWWQELEQRLGVELDIQLIPGAAYGDKIATTIAGGDMPELMQVLTLLSPQQPKFMLQGAYTDLTDILATENRAQFPNLNAIPEYAYQNSRLNGKLYAVPSPFPIEPNAQWYRGDWAENLGIAKPANAAEYQAMLQSFTTGDPDGNGNNDTYGTAFEQLNGFEQRFVHGMFRVPCEGDGFRLNDDGTFTYVIETEELRNALAYSRQLWAAGVFHPDSRTMANTDVRDQVIGSVAGGGAIGFVLVSDARKNLKLVAPEGTIVGIVPPGHDGGQGLNYNIDGYFGQVCIPSSIGKDEEKLRELLGICSFFAAPFGSEEHIFLNLGKQGVHWEEQADGSRAKTQLGEEEVIGSILGGDSVLFDANVEQAIEFQSMMYQQAQTGVFSATNPLYSETLSTKGAELSQLYTDRRYEIGTGAKELSEIENWLADWKSRGGDDVRRELEEAYAQSQG
jgi:putative aldouronate transport system substrate-binding protein